MSMDLFLKLLSLQTRACMSLFMPTTPLPPSCARPPGRLTQLCRLQYRTFHEPGVQHTKTLHFRYQPSHQGNGLSGFFQALSRRCVHFSSVPFVARFSSYPLGILSVATACRSLCWAGSIAREYKIKVQSRNNCGLVDRGVSSLISRYCSPTYRLFLVRSSWIKIEHVSAKQPRPEIPTPFLPSPKFGIRSTSRNRCWNWLYFATSNVTYRLRVS